MAASLFAEPVEFAMGVSVKFPLAEDAGVRPLGVASLSVEAPDRVAAAALVVSCDIAIEEALATVGSVGRPSTDRSGEVCPAAEFTALSSGDGVLTD